MDFKIIHSLKSAGALVLRAVDGVSARARRLIGGEEPPRLQRTSIDVLREEQKREMRVDAAARPPRSWEVEPHSSANFEFFDEEPESAPALRPTFDRLGNDMAQAMLVNASGGSADDDPIDQVSPFDAVKARP